LESTDKLITLAAERLKLGDVVVNNGNKSAVAVNRQAKIRIITETILCVQRIMFHTKGTVQNTGTSTYGESIMSERNEAAIRRTERQK
jgi:hypothetical protein